LSFEGNKATENVRRGAELRRALGVEGTGLQADVAVQIKAFAATFNEM
jgi:hypothetical protein